MVPTGHGQQPQALEMAPGLVAVRPSIALPVNPANGAAAGLAWPSGAGPDDGERAQEGGHKLRRGPPGHLGRPDAAGVTSILPPTYTFCSCSSHRDDTWR